MALFEIEDLSFTYSGASRCALENISLTVEAGEFILLCGESGCGKTTLLRLMKKQLSPSGRSSGSLKYKGQLISEVDDVTAAREVGYVMQSPYTQTVTDTVCRELSFGLECIGVESEEIRRRVAEVCGFFGIGEWYHKRICELSGGQRQLLSLACVMVTDPQVLILDEPTSFLDPIAAGDLLRAVKRINTELGVTVIMAEHRLEDVLCMADRVVMMSDRRIVACDRPRRICESLMSAGDAGRRLMVGMPSAVRLYTLLGGGGDVPLTVNEGARYIRSRFGSEKKRLDLCTSEPCTDTVLEIKDGYFRYSRETDDVLRGLSLSVYGGEMMCILGANGAGKTTLLRVLSGTRRLYRGDVRVLGKKIEKYSGSSLYRGLLACMPQDPKSLFICDSLREDMLEAAKLFGYGQKDAEAETDRLACEFGVTELYNTHPYDLSGGEQQKSALMKLLLTKPRILLLDEPTKGLDAYSREEIADILRALKNDGVTVIAVTHDVEFAAQHSDRCAMFFDGQIVSCTDRVSFFASNRYYTTAAARMTRPIYENAVTVELAARLCRENGESYGGE